MLLSDEISDQEKSEVLFQIFDWLLCQKHNQRKKDQPSVAKALQLKHTLLSILMQCSPNHALYYVDHLDKAQLTSSLNIALTCMIEKVQQVDNQIFSMVSQDQILQSKALQL
jgi:hypothetical protein